MGTGNIAPRFHNLGTRYRFVVSLTSRALCPEERAPGDHWIGGLVGRNVRISLWFQAELSVIHNEW